MNNVFIVTINYKGQENTIELLRLLEKVNKDNFRLSVVVIDNFPKEPIEIDESDYKDINLKLIYNRENLGFTGGNNVGIDYSLENGADYIIFLNNDTLVDPNFVTELIKTARSDEKIGAVVPKIYFAKGFEYHQKYKEKDLGKVIWYAGGIMDWANVIGYHRGVDDVDNGQFDKTEQTEEITGCCVLIKSEVLKKVNGYDSKYFLYYEDADLSQRIKNLGYKLIYEPKSIIWHKNAQSSGGSGSSLQDYFITRNRLLFGFRYARFRSKVALFRESLRLILSGRPWQKAGATDFYLGRFGKGRMDI